MIKGIIVAEDQNSNLISAANVSAWVTGTGAAYTLYSADAVVAFPTPAVTDHLGVLEFYASPGNYDFDIKDPHTGFARRFYNVALYSDSTGDAGAFVLKSGDTMSGNLAIQTTYPALRLWGQESLAKDWRALESAGHVFIQLNEGTGPLPVWRDMLVLSSMGTLAIGTPTPSSSAQLHLASSGAALAILERASSDTGGIGLFFRRARGNIEGLTALTGNEISALLRMQGYDGAAYQSGAEWRVTVVGAWSPTTRGSRQDFFVVSSVSTSQITALRLDHDANMLFGTPTIEGKKVIGIQNAQVVPSSNPSGGGVLYAEGGALKWRGSSGSVTTIAPA